MRRPQAKLTVEEHSPIIQCDGEYNDRPPTAIEAGVESFAGRDAMGEFLASSSTQMLETQTALQNASPETAEQQEEQIEQLIRLNAIGLMASHKATVAGRRDAMLSNREGESRVQPLRDAAANIHRLENTKEQLEEYLSNLRVIESNALLQRGDLGEILDELALSSNRIMPSEIRQSMIERYQTALESNSADTMWLFVYGSASYMQQMRQQQIEAVTASLSLFFQNFPVFSQLDAEDVVDGDYENDQALEMEAQESFAEVLLTINDTIRDIHSGDISPLDMPEAVRITRNELPPPLQTVLDEMKNSHEQFDFWLNMGLTAAEILLAFVPIIGPALALTVGAANLAMQGEEIMDQMQMVEAGANPYGDNPLGVTGPSAFEQTMFGLTAILTAVGAGSVVQSLRGGRAAISTMEEVAEASARGSDELFEGGASAVDDLVEGAAQTGDEVLEGGAARVADSSGSVSNPPDIRSDAVRLAETGSDETITLYHGTDQTGFEGLGGLDDGRISVTRSAGEHQDFSQGFYLSEDISVAESSARLRGGQRGGRMQHVMRYDLRLEDLGVIVDVRRGGAQRELWDAFLNRQLVPELPQMGTMRDYLSGLGVEQRGIYFEEFLESIGMGNADTIMGPIGDSVTTGAVTSIRGESTQVVIRSQEVADHLNEIMRGQ
ncbi:hypothetical protein H6G93_08135 [Nostoc sp. FACHB-973]|nr:hypothetical protein [Nostoc sp. FACHB-973]